MGRFDGQVVFISGVARGQGRAHALRYASEGGSVIGFDLCEQMESVSYPMSTTEDLAETVRQVEAVGGKMVSGVADVRSIDSMKTVLDDGLDAFGRLDHVIANAGILPTHGEASRQFSAWQDAIDVHLTGAMNTVELTYPIQVKQGTGGSTVIISSMAGLKPMMRTEGNHNLGALGYGAAKAGLVSLMRNYASFLAASNIRVNSVHPGGVDTPMIHNDAVAEYFEKAHPEDLKVLVSAMPTRTVETADVTSMVLWLCSDEARYFTGNVVRVDAGASLR